VVNAGLRNKLIIIQRSTTTEDNYGAAIPAAPAEFTRAMASVRYGTGQEKREAAQESAVQAATFECVTTPKLSQVVMTDSISFEGSSWDITEIAPLDRHTLRFTATRSR
jgi:head-tail adaptor